MVYPCPDVQGRAPLSQELLDGCLTELPVKQIKPLLCTNVSIVPQSQVHAVIWSILSSPERYKALLKTYAKRCIRGSGLTKLSPQETSSPETVPNAILQHVRTNFVWSPSSQRLCNGKYATVRSVQSRTVLVVRLVLAICRHAQNK